ncbi:MAG: ABC transporter substrate-binding protein [Clostridiales bacterium]|nr:ABC transporter substrate-binding protein [Clostridiales bacterium]
MKSVRKLSGILAAIMLFAFASGCQKTENTSSVDRTGSTPTINPIQVAALKGPTALGMLNLMNSDKETENYEFTIKSKPDEVVALLTSKSADIAAVPTNLAATLYNKNSSVKLLALNTLGVLYVLEKGDTIQSVKDLKGKTIYSTGQGAVPEYALNYVLEQNGLTVGKDVTVEYKTEHTELAALMAADKASVAVLPQPFVTTVTSANADVRVALDLTKEWENVNHTTLTMGCLVVRTEFLENNQPAVEQFLSAYKESAKKAVSDVEGTAKLAEEFDIIKEAVAKKAIPACNIVYIDGQDMKTKAIGFFNVLHQANPKSIGGKMPDENLYYINK